MYIFTVYSLSLLFNINSLFKTVPASALASPTIRLLEELQDNYSPNVTTSEDEEPDEVAEKEAFLDAVMQTQVMQLTESFLKERGRDQTGLAEFAAPFLFFAQFILKFLINSN